MKKRFQKAPRISKWDSSAVHAMNCIKIIEKIKGEKLPDELVKQMTNRK
jgi:hypothetical protein